MKLAKVTVAAWYVSCPFCDYELTDEDGSQLIQATSAVLFKDHPCFGCGRTFSIPAKARRSE